MCQASKYWWLCLDHDYCHEARKPPDNVSCKPAYGPREAPGTLKQIRLFLSPSWERYWSRRQSLVRFSWRVSLLMFAWRDPLTCISFSFGLGFPVSPFNFLSSCVLSVKRASISLRGGSELKLWKLPPCKTSQWIDWIARQAAMMNYVDAEIIERF